MVATLSAMMKTHTDVQLVSRSPMGQVSFDEGVGEPRTSRGGDEKVGVMKYTKPFETYPAASLIEFGWPSEIVVFDFVGEPPAVFAGDLAGSFRPICFRHFRAPEALRLATGKKNP